VPKSVYVIPDEQTITLINDKVAVKDLGLTESKYANRSITRIKRALAIPVGSTTGKYINAGATLVQTFQPPAGEFWKVTVGGNVYSAATGSTIKVGLTDGTNKVVLASKSGSYNSCSVFVKDLIATNSVYPYVEAYNADTGTQVAYFVCSGYKITKGYAAIKVASLTAGNSASLSLQPDSGEAVLITRAFSQMDSGTDKQDQVHYLIYSNNVPIQATEGATGVVTIDNSGILATNTSYYKMYMYLYSSAAASHTAYMAICGEVVE